MKVDKSKWQKKTIGDVGQVVSGATPRTDNPENWGGSLNWVTPAELKGTKYYGSTQKKITSSALSRTKLTLMPVGTVLLSSRAPIGKVAITTEPMYCNQGFKNIICDNSIHNEFLYYYLLFNNDELNRRGNGVTFKEISKKIVDAFPIAIPSLVEQKGIASELDAVQAMIYGYKEQLADLDALAKSIFLDTFGDPISNPKGWEVNNISDVTSSDTKGVRVSLTEGKVWVLNLDKIESNSGSIISYDLVSKDKIGPSTFPFDNSMILYSKLRPYLNKVVAPAYSGYATTELVPFIPKSGLNKIYFLYLLRNKSMVKTLNATSGGARMPRTKMDAMRAMSIPIPPIELQQRFAAQVEAIEKQKELLRQQIADAETLMAERMQYYFS